MPARVARSSLAQEKPRTKRKHNQKRALDAFSIATEEEPERFRVRQHRLGESEGDDPRRKRRRLEDDEDSEEEPSEPKRQQRKAVTKGRFDELDIDEGSDSDGNQWRMGEVDEDDDSDIDSEDAFGESDEERFEDFTFRGSSSNQTKPKRRQRFRTDDDGGIVLEEGGADNAEEDEEESLGEDAVDLATMLDNYEASDDEGEGEGSERQRSMDDDSEEDADDGDGLQKLDAFVSTLPIDDPEADTSLRRQRPDPNVRPGEGANRQKLSMDAFLAADENVKTIIPNFKQAKRYTSGKATEVPLPERQRAKIEREVADKKAKETLEQWVDTVKHNRRADHISFPLVDRDLETSGAKTLLSMIKSVPTTELETAIADIMQQSGLVTAGKDEEEQLQEFEELQMNKMPIEEVQARRAALRQARDLMFREEIKAKRIKKIKSKAYRRVHRKERERQAMRDGDVFGDGEADEEERERLDRRRAEERMGAKHRESKWAKAVKKTGQGAWNEDARDGITDMARRNEELRRRQQGKDVEDSDRLTASEDDDDDDVSDDEGANASYKKSLDEVDTESIGKRSGLSEMKFMKSAEAAKRTQNEEDVQRLKRELNGEDPFEDVGAEDRVAGRRQYGPQARQAKAAAEEPVDKSEFEARDKASSDEEAEIILDGSTSKSKRKHDLNGTSDVKAKQTSDELRGSNGNSKAKSAKSEGNPFLSGRPRKGKKQSSPSPDRDIEMLSNEVHSKPDAEGFTTVTYKKPQHQATSDHSDNEEQEPPKLSRNEQLIRQAFAGDDTFDDFTTEKRSLAAEDDDKVIDNSMPGWGSWAGADLSKRDKRVASSIKQRLQTVQRGIRPEDRKDAKLKNVIISEKRVKKNGSYLAGTLPFPFTSREEYERSMRMPVGGEWNTKVTVQKNTLPRVVVKQGRIITALEAPLL